MFQKIFKPKIEVLGDSSDSDESDSDEENDNEGSVETRQAWIQEASAQQSEEKPDSQDSAVGIEKTRKLIEDVSESSRDTQLDRGSEHDLATSREILHGMGQLVNSPASLKLAKEFEADEKRYAAMSVQEKIQDMAENLGSSRHGGMNNKDVWCPDDDDLD